MVKVIKMVNALNFRENISSKVFIIIQMHISLTGNITATNGDENTDAAFKNCAPFTKCITHINDEHILILLKVLTLQCVSTI